MDLDLLAYSYYHPHSLLGYQTIEKDDSHTCLEVVSRATPLCGLRD